jgi:hypothetical protein
MVVMIVVLNASQFQAQVLQAMERKKAHFARFVKGLAKVGLDYASTTSPQFSGTFASNWRLSIGQPKPGGAVKPYPFFPKPDAEPASEGGSFAVSIAMSSVGAVDGYKLGQTIYLSTSASTANPPISYAWAVEGNQIKFRSVNPSGGRVVGRTRSKLLRSVAKSKRGGA